MLSLIFRLLLCLTKHHYYGGLGAWNTPRVKGDSGGLMPVGGRGVVGGHPQGPQHKNKIAIFLKKCICKFDMRKFDFK